MTGRIRFAARTDVGPRRDHNEDAAAVFTRGAVIGPVGPDGSVAFAGATAEAAALVVLDGMGGHRSGALACTRACEFLAAELAAPWPAAPDERGAWLVALVRRLAAHLVAAGGSTGQAASGALVMVVSDAAHVVHVGDVRVYLLRGGRLVLRTRDDTLISDARDMGATEAELRQVPAGVLTQVLGFGEPTPHHQVVTLAPDDVLLLCSDGLSAVVADDELAAALRGDPAAICAALVERAIRADSADNVTLLIARREPDHAGQPDHPDHPDHPGQPGQPDHAGGSPSSR